MLAVWAGRFQHSNHLDDESSVSTIVSCPCRVKIHLHMNRKTIVIIMKQPTLKLLALFTVLTAMLFGTVSPTAAGVRTWTGAGVDANFSTAANWGGGTNFISTDSAVFTNSSPIGTTLNNDLASGTTINGMTFTANSLAYTI